jgi:hypothetical protein
MLMMVLVIVMAMMMAMMMTMMLMLVMKRTLLKISKASESRRSAHRQHLQSDGPDQETRRPITRILNSGGL